MKQQLRKKLAVNLKGIFSGDIMMEIMPNMLMLEYWPAPDANSDFAFIRSSRQPYIAPLFNLTMNNIKLQQSCLNIVSFSADLDETIANVSEGLVAKNEETKTTMLSILASLVLRTQAIEAMFERKEITKNEYLSLKNETELASKNFISKLNDEIIINFIENLNNNSESSDSIASKNNEFSQIIFTSEMRNGSQIIQQMLKKYIQLKPGNTRKLFDRKSFNFQGENLAGFLVEGNFRDFIRENMPDDVVVSFLTTTELKLKRYYEVEQNSTNREKMRFEQVSLKDVACKVDLDERINSSVLTHGIANFLKIRERNPDSPEGEQAALLVVDLFDKLNKHIEKLLQEPDQTEREKGFEEINYILNDVIRIGKSYTTVADFLQNFKVKDKTQNEILKTSCQNLKFGKNGIKLYTLEEMYNTVRSDPEKFDPKTIEKIFLESMEVSRENFPTLHKYLSQKTDQSAKVKLPHVINEGFVINELTKRRGLFGLGKRLCDQKMSTKEAKAIKRVLTESEFDDIEIYEILLKNAKNNSERVGVIKRASKLNKFNSSTVCLKFLRNIVLDNKISNNDKKELLGLLKKEPIIELLKSLSNKELANLLNNVELSPKISDIPSALKYVADERADKKIGFFSRKTVLQSLGNKVKSIFSKREAKGEKIEEKAPQEQQKKSKQQKQTSQSGFISFKETTPKKTQEEIRMLVGDIISSDVSVPPITDFIEKCPNFENQAILIARRTKISKNQLENLFNQISDKEDAGRRLLIAALGNPAVNKEKDVLEFVIEKTRKYEDAAVWEKAIKRIETKEISDERALSRSLLISVHG